MNSLNTYNTHCLNHEEVLHALAEFKVLTTPAYKNNLKLFKEYFKKPEYQNALRAPEYIKELSFLVNESNLKKKAYYEIISYYHLTDKDRNKIIPEAQMLYDALSKKVDLSTQKSRNKFSRTAVQIYTLLFINAVLFFAYAFDLSAAFAVDSEKFLNCYVYILLFSFGWIIVLILFSIIRAIIRSIKKRGAVALTKF